MPRSSGFRDLKVWQSAMRLVTMIYSRTRSFPKEELYGLTSQLRRAAVSVAANIAEGTGRATKGEFINALSNARGSVKEVETLCEVAVALEIMANERLRDVTAETEEISRMLHGLQRRLRETK